MVSYVGSPKSGRAVAFIDGQNLFYGAKEAFGYSFPNYDPLLLAQSICGAKGWTLIETRFYTGVPTAQEDPDWHAFWTRKLAVMGTRGVKLTTRPLRYAPKTFTAPNGKPFTVRIGREKGIDVRIALDVVNAAMSGSMDIALVFSQDQDLAEAVDEVRSIAAWRQRGIWLASAFPKGPTSANTRGINRTEWLPIERAAYDLCIDPNDYRQPRSPSSTQPLAGDG